MKIVTLLAVPLASALLLATAELDAQRGAPPNPGAAPAAPAQAAPQGDAANGKKIYSSYGCYQCHGFVAHGGTGPRLAPRPAAFNGFVRYVRTPTGQMPPYTSKVVSDQELADIYTFLLTIPAPPPVDTVPILAK